MHCYGGSHYGRDNMFRKGQHSLGTRSWCRSWWGSSCKNSRGGHVGLAWGLACFPRRHKPMFLKPAAAFMFHQHSADATASSISAARWLFAQATSPRSWGSWPSWRSLDFTTTISLVGGACEVRSAARVGPDICSTRVRIVKKRPRGPCWSWWWLGTPPWWWLGTPPCSYRKVRSFSPGGAPVFFILKSDAPGRNCVYRGKGGNS